MNIFFIILIFYYNQILPNTTVFYCLSLKSDYCVENRELYKIKKWNKVLLMIFNYN